MKAGAIFNLISLVIGNKELDKLDEILSKFEQMQLKKDPKFNLSKFLSNVESIFGHGLTKYKIMMSLEPVIEDKLNKILKANQIQIQESNSRRLIRIISKAINTNNEIEEEVLLDINELNKQQLGLIFKQFDIKIKIIESKQEQKQDNNSIEVDEL